MSIDHNKVYLGAGMIEFVCSLEPKSEDIDFLTERLDEDACYAVQMPPSQKFGFFIKNGLMRQIVAGCNGIVIFGALFLRQIWVAKEFRGQKYGTKLIHAVEDLARNKKCSMIIVRTMSWQAKDFYLKLGYFVEFEQLGFEKNSIMYHLRKNITLE